MNPREVHASFFHTVSEDGHVGALPVVSLLKKHSTQETYQAQVWNLLRWVQQTDLILTPGILFFFLPENTTRENVQCVC
jgi:hypothetical protein